MGKMFDVRMTMPSEFHERIEARNEQEAIEKAEIKFKERISRMKYNMKAERHYEPDGKRHYITCGDSLFGVEEVACGIKPDKEHPTEAVFEPQQVTCRECMKTKEFRDDCKEIGFEHPFTTAAKKAHETMKNNKQKEGGT